jgi:glycosyltransferase involved in cell wall biosynthesis
MKSALEAIVVVNDFAYVQGGASSVAINEAIGLAHAGYRVILFTAVGPISNELRLAPLEVICLEQEQLQDVKLKKIVALQGIWNSKAYVHFQTLLNGLNPQRTIIHVHGYTKALSASPVRAAVNRGFKIVCTIHDFFLVCPNGALFNYQKSEPCGLDPLSVSCVLSSCDKRSYAHKIYRVARAAVQSQVGKLPGGVSDYICLSSRSNDIMKHFLPEKSKFYKLANEVDVSKLDPVDVAAHSQILFIGRLEAEKGITLLLEAASKTSTKITFVGDGPLRALVEQSHGCTVTGWLSMAEVQNMLDHARCIVFPSLWYETFGLVVEQAAARGVPAIVSDVTAAAERVTHGKTGWIFKSNKVDELRSCLEEAKNDGIIQVRGKEAYAGYWTTREASKTHMQGLVRIYDQIMSSGHLTPD